MFGGAGKTGAAAGGAASTAAGGATGGMKYADTQITGGHISTKAVGPDGKQANVELFSAAQYERPDSPHKQVQAADGSQWYQVASGEGRNAFYAAPNFTGDSSETGQVSEAFPSAPQDTVLRTVDEGTIEASYPDGSNALWYSSAFYQEPDAPHETIQGSDGLSWYAMTPHAAPPKFESGAGSVPQVDDGTGIPPQPGTGTDSSSPLGAGAGPSPQPEAGGGTDTLGHTPFGAGIPGASAAPPAGPGSAAAYNQALFGQFMPGFTQEVTTVDSSRASDGVLEVRHADGSGTAFYDRTRYQPPRGDYHVYEDSGGGQWYAIPGVASVERKPVYQDGKPVYDGDILRTVNVESVRYASTPTQFAPTPKRRPVSDHKPPKRKT